MFSIPVLLLLLVRLSSIDRIHSAPSLGPLSWSRYCVLLSALLRVPGDSQLSHFLHTASHDRIDSLFFGALLGYFYHFRPQLLNNLLHSTRNRIFIAVCSAGLLSTICFFRGTVWFCSAFGYTCLYLGFGGVLLLSLYVKGILRGKIARCLELVGPLRLCGDVLLLDLPLAWSHRAWFPGLVRRILSRFSRAERAVCDLYDRRSRHWDHDVKDDRIPDSAAARSNLLARQRIVALPSDAAHPQTPPVDTLTDATTSRY